MDRSPAKPEPAVVYGGDLLSRALDLHRRGMLAEAGELYRRILDDQPGHADAKHLLGVVTGSGGDIAGALSLIGEAIAIDPGVSVYHYNRSKFLLDAERLDEALSAATRAAALKPDNALAHVNRGRALLGLGRLEESLEAYAEAVERDPGLPAAHLGRANALYAAADYEGALRSAEGSLRLQPGLAEGHATRGVALRSLGRPQEGEAALEEAVRLKPGLAKAWNALGSILCGRAEYDSALEAFGKAAALDGESIDYGANALFALQYDPAQDDGALADAARSFGSGTGERTGRFAAWPNDPDPDRTLRVGLVSSDFHRHPTAYFLESTLGAADSRAVRYTLYSGGLKGDDFTARLRQHADGWVPSAGLDDGALARRVRDDGIDILVDLSGHTAGTRLRAFAMKPAPVQATWLGSCHTTGIEAIDAIIVDPVYVPEGADDLFTEQLLRLPEIRWCYTPPAYAPAVALPPVLAKGAITFGSFNNTAKLNGAVVELWCSLLGMVPGARLMVSWPGLGEEAERMRIESLFIRRGIDAGRLLLTPGPPGHHGEVLGDYGKVDIALDPFPFSGCLTTCEALWMGVPVVTLPGTRPASRQTLGFLTVIDRLEWAAKDRGDYLRIAADLAADPERLAEMRRTQRERVASSPMCNGERFSRHIEEGLRSLWRSWCESQREVER